MADIRPFAAIRPAEDMASTIAALPYDVYNRQEAREVALANRDSFLNIDRAETQFPEDYDMYDASVYEKAAELLEGMLDSGKMIRDSKPCYYLYELEMDGRVQTGIAAASSIDDYHYGVIKKHENTRKEKEQDRIRHVRTTGAHTGPIFLAYRHQDDLDAIVASVKEAKPVYDFAADDGIIHRIWVISDEVTVAKIQAAFAALSEIYIADGHHRAASAVHVGDEIREGDPHYDSNAEFNYFLSVLFPDDQLKIYDYNRVVKDLNNMTEEAFLNKVASIFDVKQVSADQASPREVHHFGMYLGGNWYDLAVKDKDLCDDVVEGLDVSLLQNLLLHPVLGIEDPKTDARIDFVGGIRGMKELEKRCTCDCAVAFSMYPTSIAELFAVADAGKLMPPKSTWFEPKLRSGLLIHSLGTRERV